MIRLPVLCFCFLNELKKNKKHIQRKVKKTTNELDAARSIVLVPLIIVDELFVVVVFLVSRNAVD